MDPIYKPVPRSWFERLFTFPWNPLETHKDVRDYAAEFARNRRPKSQQKTSGRGLVHGGSTSVAADAPHRRRDDNTRVPVGDLGVQVWPPFVDTIPLGGFRQIPEMPVAQHLASGGGGDFVGAGAGDSWAPQPAACEAPPPDSPSSESCSYGGSGGD